MHITPRLSVEGPDKKGEYLLVLLDSDGDGQAVRRIDRAEADALIVALTPVAVPPLIARTAQSPADTQRVHLDTFGGKDGGA